MNNSQSALRAILYGKENQKTPKTKKIIEFNAKLKQTRTLVIQLT